MNWNDLRFFLATARAGSLSLAATNTQTSPATLSRHLARLERDCGAALFTRGHSGYGLTRDGQALLARCLPMEQAFAALAQALPGVQGQASGRVLVATSENLCNLVLLPALAGFCAAHPAIELEWRTGVQPIALHAREADLALRLSVPAAGNFKVRSVGKQAHALYASRALAAAGAASQAGAGILGWPQDQEGLPIARAAARRPHWREPRLRLGSLQGHAAAACAGLGLAYLPCFVGASCPGLVRIAGPDGLLVQSIHLVLHNDQTPTRRVRLVADFIIKTLRQAAPLLLGE